MACQVFQEKEAKVGYFTELAFRLLGNWVKVPDWLRNADYSGL